MFAKIILSAFCWVLFLAAATTFLVPLTLWARMRGYL